MNTAVRADKIKPFHNKLKGVCAVSKNSQNSCEYFSSCTSVNFCFFTGVMKNTFVCIALTIILVWLVHGSPVTDGGTKSGKSDDDSSSGITSFFSSYYSKTDRYDLASALLRTLFEHAFSIFYNN